MGRSGWIEMSREKLFLTSDTSRKKGDKILICLLNVTIWYLAPIFVRAWNRSRVLISISLKWGSEGWRNFLAMVIDQTEGESSQQSETKEGFQCVWGPFVATAAVAISATGPAKRCDLRYVPSSMGNQRRQRFYFVQKKCTRPIEP